MKYSNIIFSMLFIINICFLLSCSDDDDDGCTVGTDGCFCGEDGVCDEGLTCNLGLGICEPISTDADADADADSDADVDSDTDTDTDTDTDSDADSDGDADGGSDADADADGDGGSGNCPTGSTEHKTSGGHTLCCPKDSPVFCDEMDNGFGGGCFSTDIDCSTITDCGGKWWACYEEQIPYCDEGKGELECVGCEATDTQYETTSGRPVCCGGDRPTFCDEVTSGDKLYPGGCWDDNVDCGTITYCDDAWRACYEGDEPKCEVDLFSCG